MGSVSWLVEIDGDLVPPSLSEDAAATEGNFLIIAMPDVFVQPGTTGRRDIVCASAVTGQTLEARLASPGECGCSYDLVVFSFHIIISSLEATTLS